MHIVQTSQQCQHKVQIVVTVDTVQTGPKRINKIFIEVIKRGFSLNCKFKTSLTYTAQVQDVIILKYVILKYLNIYIYIFFFIDTKQ